MQTVPGEHRHQPLDDKTTEVEVVFCALLPEFEQVKLRDVDDRMYALTMLTKGVWLSDLRELDSVSFAR